MFDAFWFVPTTCPTGLAFWISTVFYGLFGTLLALGVVLVGLFALFKLMEYGERLYERTASEKFQRMMSRRWNSDRVGAVFTGVILTFLAVLLLIVFPGGLRRDAYYLAECEPFCAQEGLEAVQGRADSCTCAGEQVIIPKSPCW